MINLMFMSDRTSKAKYRYAKKTTMPKRATCTNIRVFQAIIQPSGSLTTPNKMATLSIIARKCCLSPPVLTSAVRYIACLYLY
ncbi:hypothetical protein GDO86_003755 [Hymenochirus boettgeri]|uniref:Uncharacterized protein n=1 Tax=Hymenochirus boettgeri TaxID=247094 RepID=A0A8T2K787_9PIPI|nr:hypothetical protein GDO86_003755 [Hymenochirus boettgeri]